MQIQKKVKQIEKKFTIVDTKYNLQERMTKRYGKVIDVYFYVFDEDGAKKHKKLSGFKTKADAKFAYTEFISENCAVSKEKPKVVEAEDAVPTVGELLEKYIKSLHNQNKDSTIVDKKGLYNVYVLPKYKDTPITDLTQQELYNWQDSMWNMINPKTKKPYAYKYLATIRSHFRAFLEWTETRYGYKNNFKDVRLPKKRIAQTKKQIWTEEEFQRFLQFETDNDYRVFYSVLFYTGRRLGEVLALTPNDITEKEIHFTKSVTKKTLDDSTYKVTSTKAEKEGATPICPKLQSILKTYEPKHPFVFGGEKPLSDTTVRRRFEKATEMAGLNRIRIHDLRHSFVSMLLHNNAPIPVVAALISDTIEQVTKTYAHSYDSDIHYYINQIN